MKIIIDSGNKNAKRILNYLKDLPFIQIRKKSRYNPGFVKTVLEADKNDKRHRIPTNKLWESI